VARGEQIRDHLPEEVEKVADAPGIERRGHVERLPGDEAGCVPAGDRFLGDLPLKRAAGGRPHQHSVDHHAFCSG
jgi:hypothetical protein